MKATADRKVLADTLAWVSQAIPKRVTYAGANGMRVVATDTGLQFSAFDFETSHTARLATEVADGGECFVPAGFLREVVAAMRGTTVDLVLDNGRLTVSSGRSAYGVQILDIADAPRLPEFPTEVGSLPAEQLGFLVASVAFAVPSDDSFQPTAGINFDAADGHLNAVGTNRYVLGVASADWTGDPFTAHAHVKAVQAAAKGLTGTVRVGHADGLLGFRDEERAVTMRTYSEDYADWRRLLRPTSGDGVTAEVELGELLDALKLAATVVDEGTPLALVVTDGALEVRTDAGEAGTGADVIEANLTPADADLTVGMNVRYLLDTLGAVRAGRVQLGFVDSRKPVFIRPVDHDRATHLAMPKPLGGTR